MRSGFQSQLLLESELLHDPLAVLLGEHQRDRLDLAEEVEVGSQRGDGAVEKDEVLDEQHELFGHAGSESEQCLDRSLQLADQLVGGQRRRDRSGVGQVRVARSPSSTSLSGGQRAQVTQGGHLGRDVPLEAPTMRERRAMRLDSREAGGDAEIQEGDLPRGQDEEVAPVEVAMEDAVHHGALEKPDHAAAYDGLGVDSRGAHALDVGEVEPAQSFHHEHPAGDQCGVGARDDEVALAELGEGRGDVEHVLGLEAEVELFDDGLGEELDQRRGVGQRRDRDPADQRGASHAMTARS